MMNAPVLQQEIGIIILAAGQSRRFKGDKRLANLHDGRTLLQSTLASIPSNFTRRLLVLRPGDEQLAEQFSSQWQICFAKDSAQGLGASLANAINYASTWQGAIIGLGDMPFIQPETYSALQKALSQHDIVYPVVEGKRGNPVGFNSRYFEELSTLRDDRGARSLTVKYASHCHQVQCTDVGIWRDIDTVEGLVDLQ